MQDLLVKMAKGAAKNESLIANFIQKYCQKNNKTWREVAYQLNSSEEQLAKLALCRQPTKQNFAQDLTQIAQYTNISDERLTTFLQPSTIFSSVKRALQTKLPTAKQERGTQTMVKRRAITFAIALVAILFVSAFLLSQPSSSEATLHVSTGEATITQAGSFGTSSTITVAAGESITLSSRDVIEMAANSTADLFLFEGSQVSLAENSILELTELANNESDHQIYMTLFKGRIVNRVTKLLGVDDAYEVRTPSSTASVRGTVFEVSVLGDEATEVNVTEGIVEVALGDEVAQVHAGEMVTAVTSQPLNVLPNDQENPDPTATPTDEPVDEPTDEPTNEPTDTPTEDPVDEPTEEPTDEPESAESEGESENEEEFDLERGPPTQVPGNTPGDVPGNGNPPPGNGENPGNGSGNNGNGDGSNGNNDGTGNDGNNGNGSGNNGNGDGSNGNNDGTGNDGNSGSGSGNNGNGDGSNGSNDGTGNDGNNGSGSGNSGNGDGSNGGGNGKP